MNIPEFKYTYEEAEFRLCLKKEVVRNLNIPRIIIRNFSTEELIKLCKLSKDTKNE